MKKLIVLLFIALSLVTAQTISAATPTQTSNRCYTQSYINGKWWTGNVTVSLHTSCPFAQRVTRAAISFMVRHGGVGDGDFYVRVYSPVTYKWYTMDCAAHGDLRTTMYVDCRGGIGARVVFTAHEGRSGSWQ